MHKTILLLVLCTSIFLKPVYSQKIEKMKELDKVSIVKHAIEYLEKQDINTVEIKKKNTKVMANDEFIFVYFYMGFKFEKKEKLYKTYTLYIGFSDNGTQINYNDYNPNRRKYKLNQSDRRKIKLALNNEDYSKLIETGSSYEIKEKRTYFEVTYQADDAAWCYQIDKKTRKITEQWHEHLVAPPPDNYKEIK